MKPDSSRCYPLKEQEATGTNLNAGDSLPFFFFFLPSTGDGQTRDEVAQRGCGVSIPEDTQNPLDKDLSNLL